MRFLPGGPLVYESGPSNLPKIRRLPFANRRQAARRRVSGLRVTRRRHPVRMGAQELRKNRQRRTIAAEFFHKAAVGDRGFPVRFPPKKNPGGNLRFLRDGGSVVRET